MDHVHWVFSAGWDAVSAPAPGPPGETHADGAVTQNQLAVTLVVGAMLLTAAVWAIMQVSSKLLDVFKSLVLIWFGVALYNRAAELATTSSLVFRLVGVLYNITDVFAPLR